MKKPLCEASIQVLDYIDPTKPCFIYRNLHRKCLSVRQDGIVRCHTANVVLHNCEFKVSIKGRDRVRKESSKNVHAFVKGFVVDARKTDDLLPLWDELAYNPYKYDGFTNPETGEIAEAAQYVEIDSDADISPIMGFNVSYA